MSKRYNAKILGIRYSLNRELDHSYSGICCATKWRVRNDVETSLSSRIISTRRWRAVIGVIEDYCYGEVK